MELSQVPDVARVPQSSPKYYDNSSSGARSLAAIVVRPVSRGCRLPSGSRQRTSRCVLPAVICLPA
jgi:hypothetical protein